MPHLIKVVKVLSQMVHDAIPPPFKQQNFEAFEAEISVMIVSLSRLFDSFVEKKLRGLFRDH